VVFVGMQIYLNYGKRSGAAAKMCILSRAIAKIESREEDPGDDLSGLPIYVNASLLT